MRSCGGRRRTGITTELRKKKWFISVGVLLLVVLLLCVAILPAAIQKHHNYAILKSYVAANFPELKSVHSIEGMADCYGDGQSSCPAATYTLTRLQCTQTLQAVSPHTTVCKYQKNSTYEGHTIHVRAGQIVGSKNSLVIYLAK